MAKYELPSLRYVVYLLLEQGTTKEEILEEVDYRNRCIKEQQEREQRLLQEIKDRGDEIK